MAERTADKLLALVPTELDACRAKHGADSIRAVQERRWVLRLPKSWATKSIHHTNLDKHPRRVGVLQGVKASIGSGIRGGSTFSQITRYQVRFFAHRRKGRQHG